MRQRERWGVLGNGEMTLTQEVVVPKELDDLPRLGLLLRLRGGLERLTYYGRGPEENYNDRQFGYPLGRYTSTVDDEYVPYVTPQEHGNHTDVRWFALDDGVTGVLFQPADAGAVFGQPLHRRRHVPRAPHDRFDARRRDRRSARPPQSRHRHRRVRA